MFLANTMRCHHSQKQGWRGLLARETARNSWNILFIVDVFLTRCFSFGMHGLFYSFKSFLLWSCLYIKFCFIIQYRANVSWQSLEARTSRLDHRSSILEAFEYRGSSRVHRVSSRALHSDSRQESKNYFAWLVFRTSYWRVHSFISFWM